MTRTEDELVSPAFAMAALRNGTITVDGVRAEAQGLLERLIALPDFGDDTGSELALQLRGLADAESERTDVHAALVYLGRAMRRAREHLAKAARLAALEASREATQFQPLDPASPTTRLELRIPVALVERIDAARHELSRSEYVRAAIELALGD